MVTKKKAKKAKPTKKGSEPKFPIIDEDDHDEEIQAAQPPDSEEMGFANVEEMSDAEWDCICAQEEVEETLRNEDWKYGPEPPDDEDVSEPEPTAQANTFDLVIEDGPPPPKRTCSQKWVQIFDQMEVNQSFVVPGEHLRLCRAAVHNWSRRGSEKKFVVWRDETGQHRCWRIQ
jgi:hypothetical protein